MSHDLLVQMAYCVSRRVNFKSKKGGNRQKRGRKKSRHSIADIFFQSQTFAPHGYLVAPMLKIMFGVCRSPALDKTNLFFYTGFLECYWFGVSLMIWEKTITKKRILMKETKNIINTKTKKKVQSGRSIILLLSEKTRPQTKDGRDLITTSMTPIPGAFGVLNDLGRETNA